MSRGPEALRFRKHSTGPERAGLPGGGPQQAALSPVPQLHLAMSRDTPGCHLDGGAVGTYRVGFRDAAKYATQDSRALSYLAQMAAVLSLRNCAAQLSVRFREEGGVDGRAME